MVNTKGIGLDETGWDRVSESTVVVACSGINVEGWGASEKGRDMEYGRRKDRAVGRMGIER